MKQVVLVVFDFDGVMTDNYVQVHESGEEAVWCHRADGFGVARLKQAGFEVIVLSTETNPVVDARCRKLKIEAYQGRDDKASTLRQLMRDRNVGPEQVAYVGNDLNDIPCMRLAGWPVAVADAVPEVRAVAKWVTRLPGGKGAVREVADWLIQSRSENDASLQWVRDSLWHSIELRQSLLGSGDLLRQVLRTAQTLTDVLRAGGRVYVLGGGVASSDARAFAAELVRRLTLDASSVTVLATPAEDSSVTASAPDHDPSDQPLVRELANHARPGDLAIGLLSDPEDQTLLRIMYRARQMALRTVLVTGARPQGIHALVDEHISLPVNDPWLIEEAHISFGRILTDYAARALRPHIPLGTPRRSPREH